MYFLKYVHITYLGVCIVCHKCINIICAVDYGGALTASFLPSCLLSSIALSLQALLSLHYLREHLRATGLIMGIGLNGYFLLSK